MPLKSAGVPFYHGFLGLTQVYSETTALSKLGSVRKFLRKKGLVKLTYSFLLCFALFRLSLFYTGVSGYASEASRGFVERPTRPTRPTQSQGLLRTICSLVRWMAIVNASSTRCCRCNGTAKCLRCTCVRSGAPCSRCLPGDLGFCHNTRPRGRSPPSCPSSSLTTPAPSPLPAAANPSASSSPAPSPPSLPPSLPPLYCQPYQPYQPSSNLMCPLCSMSQRAPVMAGPLLLAPVSGLLNAILTSLPSGPASSF